MNGELNIEWDMLAKAQGQYLSTIDIKDWPEWHEQIAHLWNDENFFFDQMPEGFQNGVIEYLHEQGSSYILPQLLENRHTNIIASGAKLLGRHYGSDEVMERTKTKKPA